jgi:hypothetical protein
MTYTHRNGETEPPQVAGWYWFTGVFAGNERYVGSVTVARSFAGNLCVIGSSESISLELQFWAGQWWGPIVPPWEAAP